MASVRASTRVSISWDGQDAFEDTDTLVLTINDFSLDLRVFSCGPLSGQIDWSTVAKVTEAEGSTQDNPKLVWDHIIDSRTPTDMPDQGTFATLPNGDVAETGVMHNPKTGLYQDYVEIWRRFPPETGAPFCVLERLETKGSGDMAFLGRVGSRALGLGKAKNGLYSAFKELSVEGESRRTFEAGDAGVLPNVPEGTLQTGDTVELSGRKWLVRTAGVL